MIEYSRRFRFQFRSQSPINSPFRLFNPQFHSPITKITESQLKFASDRSMAEEEFEESDVVFTGNNDYEDHCCDSDSEELSRRAKRKKVEKKAKAVKIPEIYSWFDVMEPSLFDYEEDDEGEIVPPHVMVLRRRVAEKMAFSVCSGIGRTLKGRDLSEVRNCVLRMTGFLET